MIGLDLRGFLGYHDSGGQVPLPSAATAAEKVKGAMVVVVHAEVKVRLSLECCDCETPAMSETIRLEYVELTPDDLAEGLNAQMVRTHFPVGWASYAHGKFRCPKCKELNNAKFVAERAAKEAAERR